MSSRKTEQHLKSAKRNVKEKGLIDKFPGIMKAKKKTSKIVSISKSNNNTTFENLIINHKEIIKQPLVLLERLDLKANCAISTGYPSLSNENNEIKNELKNCIQSKISTETPKFNSSFIKKDATTLDESFINSKSLPKNDPSQISNKNEIKDKLHYCIQSEKSKVTPKFKLSYTKTDSTTFDESLIYSKCLHKNNLVFCKEPETNQTRNQKQRKDQEQRKPETKKRPGKKKVSSKRKRLKNSLSDIDLGLNTFAHITSFNKSALSDNCIKKVHKENPKLGNLFPDKNGSFSEKECILSSQVQHKSSLHQLLQNVNEVILQQNLGNDSKEFLTDVLKMKTVIQSSTENKSDASIMLDESLVHASFKYFKYLQKIKKNTPLNNLTINNNIWNNCYAVVNSTSVNIQQDANVSNNNPSYLPVFNSKSTVTNQINNTFKDFVVSNHNLTDLSQPSSEIDRLFSANNIIEESEIKITDKPSHESPITTQKLLSNNLNNELSNILKENDKKNDMRELSNKCDNEFPLNIVSYSSKKNMEEERQSISDNINLPSEQSFSGSYTKGISNSRSLYDIDILADEPLDYEPSEASDTSDIESCKDDSIEITKSEQRIVSFHRVSEENMSVCSAESAQTNQKQSDVFNLKNENKTDFLPENTYDIQYFQEDTPLMNDINYTPFSPHPTVELSVNDVQLVTSSIKNTNSCIFDKNKQNDQVQEKLSGNDHNLQTSNSCSKNIKLNESLCISSYVNGDINSSERHTSSEEGSENDNDHSFKRKISSDVPKNNSTLVNLMGGLHQSKEVIGFLHNYKDVMCRIQKLSEEGKISEMLQIAKKYIPIKMSLEDMILFLRFVKEVCQTPFPKCILQATLERFIEANFSCSVEFFQICKFLCCIQDWEIDMNCLQKFIQLCMQNDCWKQIADFLYTWIRKGPLLHCLCKSFVFQIEKIGYYYERLAEVLFAESYLSHNAVNLISQIGVSFMLEASANEQYEQAFQILNVFNKNNIQFLKLQESLYGMPYVEHMPDPTANLVFPFTVLFAALDVCFHLNKPKEAYAIFQSFSLNLPNSFDSKLKLEIRSRWFHCLLRITTLIYFIDPFDVGTEALKHLLTTAEKDFSMEELNEYATDLLDVYNKYMTGFLKMNKEEYLKWLYPHMFGSKCELYVVKEETLRGLFVYFNNKDIMKQANKIFALGYARNIFEIGKPFLTGQVERQMMVRTCWIKEEIKFIFLKFIESITPFVKRKPRNKDFDRWFSTRIIIKHEGNIKPILKQSRRYAMDCKTAMNKICEVLKELDPNVKFSQFKNTQLILEPEWVYNFWLHNFSKILSVKGVLSKFILPKRKEICFGSFGSKYNYHHMHDTGIASDINTFQDVTPSKKKGIHCSSLSIGINDHSRTNVTADLNNFQITISQQIQDKGTRNVKQTNNKLSLHPQIMKPHRELSTDNGFLNSMKTKKKTQLQCTKQKLNFNNNSEMSKPVSKAIHFENFRIERQIMDVKQPPVQINCNISDSNFINNSEIAKPIPEVNSQFNTKLVDSIKPSCTSNQNVQVSELISGRELPPKLDNCNLSNGNYQILQPPVTEIQPNSKLTDGNIKSVLEMKPQEQLQKPDFLKSNVPEIVFQKINLFLKSKVMVRRKDLIFSQQQLKAIELTKKFLQIHNVTCLDKKTMKLLNEFSDKFVS
ncbi:uncharacterized protein CDAR_266901 [Caerostris darwini]|uniref:Uncharacterized protein n=1 Tax=Caerostris darwini TaxID=1538125 RepID=A0AAV4R2Q0_9ARAC|nr:uncharacterized protein CDAR_266901 [Caerostris darwini]